MVMARYDQMTYAYVYVSTLHGDLGSPSRVTEVSERRTLPARRRGTANLW